MGQLVYKISELIKSRNENVLVNFIRPEVKWSNHD